MKLHVHALAAFPTTWRLQTGTYTHQLLVDLVL